MQEKVSPGFTLEFLVMTQPDLEDQAANRKNRIFFASFHVSILEVHEKV